MTFAENSSGSGHCDVVMLQHIVMPQFRMERCWDERVMYSRSGVVVGNSGGAEGAFGSSGDSGSLQTANYK